MDNIDFQIIEVLDNDGRATATEISKHVNLSIPAVSERIRNLEESGVIEKYTLKLNRKKLGYKLIAFIFINIDTSNNINEFRSAINSLEEVLECHHIAGEYDYMLKVLVEDTDELEFFISNKLKKIYGIVRSNTLINLSTIKETQNRKIKG